MEYIQKKINKNHLINKITNKIEKIENIKEKYKI